MVLVDLGRGINAALQRLLTQPLVDEKVLDELLKEICRALLEADVNVRLVQTLRQNVKRTVNLETLAAGVNKKRIIQRAVFAELCRMVEPQKTAFRPVKGQPNVVMFVGLQGSGKTTSCTKLAHHYSRKGWRVGLVCGDTFRAGAFDQLRQNAAKGKIPFFGSYDEADPVKIVAEGCELFRAKHFDLIIVDTSGRHSQETELFREMQQIAAAARPDAILFVMDASIGQAAESQAQAFKTAVPVGGIVLTKMDGQGRGGGALSAVATTGAPVAFIGTGEHMYDFEPFEARAFVGRLLGMGDMSGLMERVSEAAKMTSQEKTLEMARRMDQGLFTLRDLYDQLQMMLSMGPVSKMMAMLPGMGGSDLFSGASDEDITRRLRSFVVCMDSMTRAELDSDGKLFSTQTGRVSRVARGAGCREETVHEMLQHHRKFAQLIKKMGGGARGGVFKNLMAAASGRAGASGVGASGASQQMMQQMQMLGGADGLMEMMKGQPDMMAALGGANAKRRVRR